MKSRCTLVFFSILMLFLLAACTTPAITPVPGIYRITITLDGEGTVAKTPDQPSYTEGTEVQLEAVPETGWVFDHWELNLTGTTPTTSVTVDTDLYVKAVFTRVQEPAVFRVPQDYDTIQQAIDAAADGTTIIVSPGVYQESIVFKGKVLTLQSTDPDDPAVVFNTILTGVGENPVVGFIHGETGGVLEGFTITCLDSLINSSGIECRYGAKPVIRKNVITYHSMYGILVENYSAAVIQQNTIEMNGLGGIHVKYSASAVIEDNTIKNNQSDTFGGGIRVYNLSSATISNNSIEGNIAVKGGGISIDSNAEALVENNDLYNNELADPTTGNGTGIYCNSYSTVQLIGNSILETCSANLGGAIFLANSEGIIKNNIFKGEAVMGGALYIDSCENTTIEGNEIRFSSAAKGGCIYLNSSETVLNGNIIAESIATSGAGVYLCNSTSAIYSNSFSDLAAADTGGGIFVDLDSTVSNADGTAWPRAAVPPAEELTNTYAQCTPENVAFAVN